MIALDLVPMPGARELQVGAAGRSAFALTVVGFQLSSGIPATDVDIILSKAVTENFRGRAGTIQFVERPGINQRIVKQHLYVGPGDVLNFVQVWFRGSPTYRFPNLAPEYPAFMAQQKGGGFDLAPNHFALRENFRRSFERKFLGFCWKDRGRENHAGDDKTILHWLLVIPQFFRMESIAQSSPAKQSVSMRASRFPRDRLECDEEFKRCVKEIKGKNGIDAE